MGQEKIAWLVLVVTGVEEVEVQRTGGLGDFAVGRVSVTGDNASGRIQNGLSRAEVVACVIVIARIGIVGGAGFATAKVVTRSLVGGIALFTNLTVAPNKAFFGSDDISVFLDDAYAAVEAVVVKFANLIALADRDQTVLGIPSVSRGHAVFGFGGGIAFVVVGIAGWIGRKYRDIKGLGGDIAIAVMTRCNCPPET